MLTVDECGVVQRSVRQDCVSLCQLDCNEYRTPAPCSWIHVAVVMLPHQCMRPRHCSTVHTHPPSYPPMFSRLYSCYIRRVPSLMQSGSDCLKTFVAVAPQQIASGSAPGGTDGSGGEPEGMVVMLLKVVGKLLDGDLSESASLCVGGLVAQMVIHLGDAMPNDVLQEVFVAALQRLSTAQTLPLKQTLVR